MGKRIALFTGTERDEYGMPAPIHFYGIFATEYKQDKKYVAVTRIAVSADTPSETEGTKLIKANSEEEAIGIAIEELRNYPSNRGLTLQSSTASMS